jgi:hypothetical protein
MSKRSVEAAMKAYPLKDYTKEPNYIHTCDTKMLDEVYRDVFKIGYKQAEKELAEFISTVQKMRHAQAEFRRTRIAGWDYEAQRQEKKVDEMIKEILGE